MNENLTSPMSMEAVRKNINSTYRPLVRVKRQNYGESMYIHTYIQTSLN